MPCCSLHDGPSRGNIIGRTCSKQQLMKSAMTVLALMLVYRCGYVRCATVPQDSTDMLALIDFRQAITGDPKGFFYSWNNSVNYCNWNGVTCSKTHRGRVRELNLTGQSLEGRISLSLGNLTILKILDLSSNSLSGQLPDLNCLRKLQFLVMSNNKLQHFAPNALTNCSNLLHLDLSANNLVGSIPPGISFLYKLEFLNLQSNNFTGPIPSSLGNITQLASLFLYDNQLEGSIPTELGLLSNMFQLSLGENKLSGSIPTTILNHSYLSFLDLSSNSLRMALPSTIGNTLPNIVELGLNNNKFHGQIPASLGNPPNLSIIQLNSNYFTGPIPSSLGNLSYLSNLILDQNKLQANDSKSWEFLDALSNCSDLQVLSLYDNQLQGAIPNSIGKLSPGLQYLALDKNNLSGTVPESIGNHDGLSTLFLGENNLAGPIGSWVGKLQNLAKFDISDNCFSGSIPSSIGSFTQLIELYLQNNKFDGFIPPSLGNLRLLVLNLSYNNLQGTIPNEIFPPMSPVTNCVLSNNNLEGQIPPEVGNLRQLIELHLSSNRITGEIPDSLGHCQELQEIKIDQNLLTGNIPMSLGSMKSLSTINLSHNSLSGAIPTPLANLQFLTWLDLSYNNLKGEIPINGVFANATAVSLNSNWGLCGGVKDLHMPACSAVSWRIKWKVYLTILLIVVFGFMSCAMSIYIKLMNKKSRSPYLMLLSFGKKFPRVSYKDLAQATGNFLESNLIGRGSYGSVYKGKLTQAKMQVAIKVFDLDMRFADSSFVSECEALRIVQHRNLLPILTACSTIDNRGNDFKALIYVFMPNGNLDTWLHKKGGPVVPQLLGLTKRMSIAADVAEALAYLHHDCRRPIVHCDLKPTNILLDDDMNAHIGDFGIASLVDDSRTAAVGHSGSNSSVAVTGTIGYIPPEYAQTVHASTCGDVYSFGIVLLEMIIGKRPTDPLFDGGFSITSFVDRNFPDQLLHIIDAHLQEECNGFIKGTAATENEAYQCVLSLVQVALACTCPFPRERMNMREVAINLHAIRKSYVAAIK